ncbi:mas-related G-protein coupled receptor MRG-like [Cavia porcellus]|uniref:mas-related G-protein coupled receptor MRG-like n=1 Tax=Cavia porcellus TaxID=10141 RepID=UPI002FE38D67
MACFNSTSSPWNRTDEKSYYHAAYTQAMKIICPLGIVISLLGLGGNGLVLFFLVCTVKRDSFSVFLFHLALADFSLLACLVVDFMGEIFAYFHNICFPLPYLNLFFLISYVAGLCLVVAISLGRCLSVFFPIWYRLHSPKYTSTIVCVLTWVWAISISVLGRMFCDYDLIDNKLCGPLFKWFCLFIIVILSATLLCTVIMLLKIKCSSRVRPPRKLYIAVALTAVSLVSLALPMLGPFLPDNPHIPYDNKLISLFSCVNSSVNPLVYYFAGRMGRQRRHLRLREVFQRAMGEEVDPSSGASGHST